MTYCWLDPQNKLQCFICQNTIKNKQICKMFHGNWSAGYVTLLSSMNDGRKDKSSKVHQFLMNCLKWLFTWSGEKPFGAYLHWYCLRIRARVHVWAPERVLFTLHPRLRFEIIRGHGHLVTCSSDRIKRRFWACVLHNLGRNQMSASKKIATRSDELRHGCPRQKSQTHTRISVNTKHWFTCFDCIWARTRLLGLRSRM